MSHHNNLNNNINMTMYINTYLNTGIRRLILELRQDAAIHESSALMNRLVRCMCVCDYICVCVTICHCVCERVYV